MEYYTWTLRLCLLPLLAWTVKSINIRQVIDQQDTTVQMRNIIATMQLPVGQLLRTSGPFTMFVPADEAFERMPSRQRSRLLSQGSRTTRDMVDNQFRYHIVRGRLTIADMEDGERNSRALNSPPLFIRVFPNGIYVNGARIIREDIIADNGIVHIIDTYLGQPLDPGNGVPLQVSALGYIVDKGDLVNKNERQLKTTKFWELLDTYKDIKSSGATFALEGWMTAFIPSDAAIDDFTSNDIAALKQDTTALTELVERHIIASCNSDTGVCEKGMVYHTNILRDFALDERSPKIQAMAGEISPTIFNNELYIGNDCGGSSIVWGNITVSNGVIHMIDGFLGFRQKNVLSYLKSTRNLGTFYTLVDGAPLDISNLLNEGSSGVAVPSSRRVTVFAPQDNALEDYRFRGGEERELHTRYHVLEGELPVKDMTNGTEKYMISGSPGTPRIRATFTQYENGDTYITVDHVRARIIRPNVCVKNGLIHIIDGILGVPIYSLWSFIERNLELSDLYEQLTRTGLQTDLKQEEIENIEFTFFAPVNQAMELMQGNKMGRRYLNDLQIATRLSKLLYGRHMAYGSIFIDEITELETEVTTYTTETLRQKGNNFQIICPRGKPCHIQFDLQVITFNRTDIKMTNGVLHLINQVIYTGDEEKEQALISAAPAHRASTLCLLILAYFLHKL